MKLHQQSISKQINELEKELIIAKKLDELEKFMLKYKLPNCIELKPFCGYPVYVSQHSYYGDFGAEFTCNNLDNLITWLENEVYLEDFYYYEELKGNWGCVLTETQLKERQKKDKGKEVFKLKPYIGKLEPSYGSKSGFSITFVKPLNGIRFCFKVLINNPNYRVYAKYSGNSSFDRVISTIAKYPRTYFNNHVQYAGTDSSAGNAVLYKKAD